MKTKHFLLAALAAISLASCSSDDFVGSESSPDKMQNNTIAFGSGFKAITRANEHVGADAANLLNKHFTVSGYKVSNGATANDAATSSQVFYDYVVNWQANTAGTTESNTSDWEYVGVSVAKPSTLCKEGTDVKQTIKYWDLSTDYYDFIAYSTGTATPVAGKTAAQISSDDEVGVVAIDYAKKDTKAYTFAGTREGLAKCYIADMVTVKKTNYQKEVQLSFRSLASKVRMAIYETVPGYSVKDVKFYTDDTTPISTGAEEEKAGLFTTGSDAGKDYFFTKGTFTITYPHTGSDYEAEDAEFHADYNVAHTSFTPEENSSKTQQLFGNLEYTTADGHEAVMDGTTEKKMWLGRNLNEASYATDKDYYVTMLPNPEGTVLELRIDYTLVSTDGSGEEIKIYGAKAFVPATYTQWLSNYAYTYIFKISDNTNGWTTNIVPVGGTEPTDPAGLYPITFDAVVIDTEEGKQSTVTTVATPSITTYQMGHDVLTDEEYDAAKGDIYLQVIINGSSSATLATDLADKGKLYKLAEAKTEAEVMDALNLQESNTTTSITGRNGLVLTEATTEAAATIPCVDGNNITPTAGSAVKFTPSAGTYAYVYEVEDKDDTYIYAAVKLEERPSDWTTRDLWYDDPDGKTEATTFDAGTTYYKKYTQLNKNLGVKVIKVK
ncbi:MAG: hypothetical protein J5797_03405 [Prevotella sp.]|nr:hypothetical protein [Prevotella sp.]